MDVNKRISGNYYRPQKVLAAVMFGCLAVAEKSAENE